MVGSGVDDATLPHIEGLVELKKLTLATCEVSNAGMSYLAALPRLVSLDLSGCDRITDAGFKEQFTRLAHLKLLDIHGTGVTGVGVKELQRARPNLELEIDGPLWYGGNF